MKTTIVGDFGTVTNADMKEHEGLVMDIAKRFQGCGVELDDLIQVGKIGLLHALRNFDQSKGMAFSTYAHSCIRGQCLNEVNRNKLEEPGVQSLSSMENDADFDIPDASPARNTDVKTIIDRFLPELSEREQTVLKMRYGIGTAQAETLKDIGDRLGLTKERIRQIESGALNRLRTMISC